jgi:hypothetical protein
VSRYLSRVLRLGPSRDRDIRRWYGRQFADQLARDLVEVPVGLYTDGKGLVHAPSGHVPPIVGLVQRAWLEGDSLFAELMISHPSVEMSLRRMERDGRLTWNGVSYHGAGPTWRLRRILDQEFMEMVHLEHVISLDIVTRASGVDAYLIRSLAKAIVA